MKANRRELLGFAAMGGIAAATAATPAFSSSSSPEFEWRMQCSLAANNPGYRSIQDSFVDAVAAMSGGRMKINLFPAGALFPTSNGLEAVVSGIAEIGMMTGSFYNGKMGPIATLESGTPGAERNGLERFAFFYQKGFLDIARKAYARQNVYYLAPHLSPSWDIVSNRPISSASDFSGLRIRASGVEAQWFSSMGASPTPIDGGETYTALATGVLDAARFGSPSYIHETGLHEVTKYLVQPSLMPAPNNNILINTTAWQSLPDDLKHMLDEAAKLASIDYLARGVALDSSAIKNMVAQGMEISRIPEDQLAEMEQGARKLWRAYAETDELTAEAVALLDSFLEELGR